MPEALQIVVNGRERVLENIGQGSLADVLVALELQADRIAVEHNGEIAPRSAWAARPVAPGDRLEIVHFVGGGISCVSQLRRS